MSPLLAHGCTLGTVSPRQQGSGKISSDCPASPSHGSNVAWITRHKDKAAVLDQRLSGSSGAARVPVDACVDIKNGPSREYIPLADFTEFQSDGGGGFSSEEGGGGGYIRYGGSPGETPDGSASSSPSARGSRSVLQEGSRHRKKRRRDRERTTAPPRDSTTVDMNGNGVAVPRKPCPWLDSGPHASYQDLEKNFADSCQATDDEGSETEEMTMLEFAERYYNVHPLSGVSTTLQNTVNRVQGKALVVS